MYRRVCLFVFAMTLVSGLLLAQSNPAIGTWKLNLAKSKYSPPSAAPKEQTRTVEAQGDGAKYTFDGAAGDGSRIAWNFTTNYDAKDSSISGVGQPLGAESIAIKRVNPNTFTYTLSKASKVIMTGRAVVSKDGKTTTITSKGTNEQGQTITSTQVYDKQ